MKHLKQYLCSPVGMNLVNVLFWAAILLSQDLIQLIAYGCWIAYLIYCIRRSSSKIVTVVYGLFLVFAAVMVIGGGYTLMNHEEEPTRVYAFHGENDQFSVSNGVIVVSDEEDVFYGGTLEEKGEHLSDLSAYSISFYFELGSETHTLLSNRIIDTTGTPIHLPDELGKVSGNGIIEWRRLEQLESQLYCELETKDLDGNIEVQQIQMEVVQITKE